MIQGFLHKKNIVIVGGSSGIGLSAAKAFLTAGANLVIVGGDIDSCEQAKHELGSSATILCADATETTTAVSAIERCLQDFGDFNGLYHVAGGSGRKFGDGMLHQITIEGWNKTLALNLTSLMLSNQAAVLQFQRDGKGGSILNMGSVLGFSPAPFYFGTHAYAAAKSAIIGFTKSLAASYASKNIRVNAILPGLVDTPMAQRAAGNEAILNYIKTKQPLDGGRIGKAEDLDGLASYFMSDYAAFTTGQCVAVDGGWSVSEGQWRQPEKTTHA